ncbi:hypothetical protein AAV35_013770 (plasmid) [Salimicrobium jeotgali]|uniref:Uncharacterized protein n=1 Tax=Salimicrobium jeotgali TaxID=1230341 RepID=K2G8V1_9BACI|nr:DUF6423 family protein [Salimicrobium jeotgali]AKG05840.1 hypothetical protein AAV35_013770 [Salimicrobium jeotgali]EKE30797.1 hypothetical protein MJ3_11785 [Salimicrobium jeotgali]MBM7697604.1 hypothetical protein [Salimicrobium jeotgali]
MRATDIHTTAAIDEKRRIVMLTGAIDASGYVINMRTPLPSAGEWTVVKAETNLSNHTWATWQMVLGENVSVAMDGDSPELLMSRNFENVRYIPEKNVVVYYGGKPVRPGETVLKFFKVHTKVPEILTAHPARIAPDNPDYDDVITGVQTNQHLPKMEIVPVVQNVNLPEVYNLENHAISQ